MSIADFVILEASMGSHRQPPVQVRYRQPLYGRHLHPFAGAQGEGGPEVAYQTVMQVDPLAHRVQDGTPCPVAAVEMRASDTDQKRPMIDGLVLIRASAALEPE
ncbi:hypothetical protein OG196_32125 [Kitasatospora purpeofusca]|uniref:hypothetical protein n=1 Tax=Kitasatospora purpeofusca TaxID=67352 RepID=UPI002E12F00B|nr:hypothetical protein OG196_32125 [Kitasatospora purpeofusca]